MTTQTGTPRPGGWYYGWTIVAVLIITLIATMGLAVNSFSLFLHDWSSDLKVSISSLQLAAAPGAVMSSLLGPFVGRMADRYPARLLIGGGILCMSALYLGLSFVTNLWQFVALFGFGFSVLITVGGLVAMNPLVSRWFVKRLGLALGLTALGLGLAGVVVPPLVAAGLPVVGWRGVWRIAAGVLAFGIAPLLFLVLRDRPTEREGLHYVTAAVGAPSHHHRGGLSWREIVGRKNFWLIGAMYLPIFSTYQSILYNLAPIAASHGLSPQAAATLVAVLSVTWMAGTPLLGILSDRFGNRVLYLGLALVVAVGAVLLAFASSLPALLVGSALLGFGGAVWTLIGASIALEYGSANAGQAFGLLIAFVPLSGGFVFMIAKLKETTGSYTAGILAMTAMLAVSAVAALVIREKRGGHLTAEERVAAAMEEVVSSPLV